MLAITRLPNGQVASLRQEVAHKMGLDLDEPRSLAAVEARARELVEAAAGRDWAVVPADSPTVAWICDWLVPNLARATDEIDLRSGR